MRDKPAVVYPASVVGSVLARADMESASPLRQSLQAAGVKLPAVLSASNSAGASRCAMMDDQSLRKGGWVKTIPGLSSRHRIDDALDLFLQRRSRVIRLAITQRRIADPGELVGNRASGLVVIGAALHGQSPAPQTVELPARRVRDAGRAQHGARAMREQHAQVAVAALGDAAQGARAARRELFWRQTEPAGEMLRILEVADLAAGGGDHRRGRQQADAGDREQDGAGRTLPGQHGQFTLQLGDARFKHADFLDQQLHGAADQRRHRRIWIGQHSAHLLDAVATAADNGDAEFAAEAAQRIDARRACSHPQGTRAMQPLQGLLLDRFDLDRRDVGAARRFDQGAGVGGVGLVAFDVGADVGGGQQPDLDAETVQPARPMVRRAARLHDDQRYVAVDEPAFELAARKAVLFDDAPGGIGHGKLEYRFGKINGNGRSSIHGGLLSLVADPHPHVDQCVYVGAKRRRESIPSLKRTGRYVAQFIV
jgi:hypothetical protein